MILRMSNVDKHQTLHTSAVQAHAPSYVRYEPTGYIAILKKSFKKPGTIVKTAMSWAVLSGTREIVIGLWPGAAPNELPELSPERK